MYEIQLVDIVLKIEMDQHISHADMEYWDMAQITYNMSAAQLASSIKTTNEYQVSAQSSYLYW